MSATAGTLALKDECTVGGYIAHIAPSVWNAAGGPMLPGWPPDMFAIVASLLNITGAYRRILSCEAIRVDWGPQNSRRNWVQEIKRIGTAWRRQFFQPIRGAQYPQEIDRWWNTIVKHSDIELCKVSHIDDLCRSMFNLLAASDEASVGVGFPEKGTGRKKGAGQLADFLFLFEARYRLEASRKSFYGMTLCKEVHPSRARVLPKMHTPRTGMTLRSLSHHLALCPADETKITWASAQDWWEQTQTSRKMGAGARKHLNLLLVPWPMEIHPSDIYAVQHGLDGEAHRPQRLFKYEPAAKTCEDAAGVCHLVELLLERSAEIIGEKGIDGVILPELAVSNDEYNELKKIANKNHVFLIAGIRGTPGDGHGYSINELGIYFPIHEQWILEYIQSKHHRWLLESSQITNYGLVSRLHPDSDWWEAIEITPRELKCVALAHWLYLCALICEDLARQDPMASLVRAIGPSLLIALLMDGPQLTARWASRYATVLADDPGTSVLTFTSLGMVKLSHAMRPSGKDKASRTIALWKDSQTGVVEIDLPNDAYGVVLCLTNKKSQERTADGRIDHRTESLLVLGGVHSIGLKKTKRPPADPEPVVAQVASGAVRSTADPTSFSKSSDLH